MGSIEHKCWLRDRLDSFLGDELRGPCVTRLLLEGDPADNIIDLASTEKADLIVMSTHGHRPLRQLLLSSLVAKVLRSSSCPVWTGVHLADVASRDLVSFHKIACAIDLGPYTRSALIWASQLASAFGAMLLVIHVTKPATGARLGGSTHSAQTERVKQAREEIEYLLRSIGVNAEIAVGAGSVSQVVYDLALGFAADILVIGHYADAHRLHSDTYTMIRQSHCPVVSV